MLYISGRGFKSHSAQLSITTSNNPSMVNATYSSDCEKLLANKTSFLMIMIYVKMLTENCEYYLK